MHLNLKYCFIKKFNLKHLKNLDKDIAIIYRNYQKSVDKKTINKIKNYCKKNNQKFFLSNDIKLSVNLNLDGAYIPSFNKSFENLNYSYKKKFEIIGSAHNLKEIRIKEKQKVSKIFLSSLFKENRNFLGLNRFKLLSTLTKKKIVALGGISKKNIKLLKILDSYDFAGISYFE